MIQNGCGAYRSQSPAADARERRSTVTGTGTYIFLADQGVQGEQALATGATSFDLSWMYLVIALWCMAMLTFRQGRRLWRRAWE